MLTAQGNFLQAFLLIADFFQIQCFQQQKIWTTISLDPDEIRPHLSLFYLLFNITICIYYM